MHYVNNTELSSLEETRCQFNGGPGAIKSAEGRIRPVCGLGIDVHQDFYVVVEQVDGSNPKPAQRFQKEAQLRAVHRQREQLVKVRKQLEAQGRTLMVNHGIEPVKNWWKRCNFGALQVPTWMKELLQNSQPILFALQEKIAALTVQLQNAAAPKQPRGLGKMTSVIIDREIGDWRRFNKSASDCQLHRALPWRILQREYATAKLCDQARQPALARCLGGVGLPRKLSGFQPNYKPIIKWKEVLRRGALATGAARKKAIVAVARQLAVDLWRIRTGRVSAATLGLIN